MSDCTSVSNIDCTPVSNIDCTSRLLDIGGRKRLYTYRYTVTTKMIHALRWAVIKVILMFD